MNKSLILNRIRLSIGVLTFLYLYLSLKCNYGWTIFAGGFVSVRVFIPITIISGTTCIFSSLIALFFNKERVKSVFCIIHIILAVAWIILLQGLSIMINNEWGGKPKGVILDKNTRLGEIISNTKWVASDQRIFYISSDTKFYPQALCSIGANGNNPKKIIDNCINFGWLSNGNMFALCDGTLFLLTKEGDAKEKIYSSTYYNEYNDKGPATKRSVLSFFELSPEGNKVAIIEHGGDTNKDGRLDWRDGKDFYIIDIPNSKKEKINFGQDIHFEKCLWDKSGNKIYVVYSKIYSPMDVRYELCEYDFNTKLVSKIKEVDFKKGMIKISDYIKEETLFYNKQKYFDPFPYSAEIEPRNDIKLSIGRYDTSLYIQRGENTPKKIFEYIGSIGYDVGYRPAVYNLHWLPSNRYVACVIRGYICILDTQDEKIGMVAKGTIYGWYDMP